MTKLYQLTPRWARNHNVEDAQKLTHKLLDCSDLQVKFIPEILRMLDCDKSCLINVMLEATEYLQQCLRLDSPTFANTCIQIILEMVNMAAKYLGTPHKAFIMGLTKYALGLKGYSNYLSL